MEKGKENVGFMIEFGGNYYCWLLNNPLSWWWVVCKTRFQWTLAPCLWWSKPRWFLSSEFVAYVENDGSRLGLRNWSKYPT